MAALIEAPETTARRRRRSSTCARCGAAPAQTFGDANRTRCGPCYVETMVAYPGDRWLWALRDLGPSTPLSLAVRVLEWLERLDPNPHRARKAAGIRASLTGLSASTIAEREGLTGRTIVRWRKAWRQGGWREVVRSHTPPVVEALL